MGPGKSNEKEIGIMNPPIFEPDQDLLVWRKKVASWVDLIATAASKGSDKFYKTVFCTLGSQLYDRGLRQAQQSLVDEAQEQGKIDYKQEDQVKAVQEIVDLITQDPPIAVVTRLIDSFNKVTLCKRKGNEDLNRFVSRFRGLAAEHLMRAGSSNHSQIGEVLAITLLNNVALSEASLTNANLRLIGMAEERAKIAESDEKTIKLKSSEARNLLQLVENLRKPLTELKHSSNFKSSIRELNLRYNKVAEGVLKIPQSGNRNDEVADVTKAIASNGPRFFLSLDDAVSVLRSLEQTGSKPDHVMKKAEVDSAVDQKVRSFFTNHRSNEPDKSSTKDRRNRKTSGTKRKFETIAPVNSNGKNGNKYSKSKRFKLSDLNGDSCEDCGSSNHSRGDSECKHPSFATRKIREAKSNKDADSSDDENPSNEGGYFHPGSKHTKGKGVL